MFRSWTFSLVFLVFVRPIEITMAYHTSIGLLGFMVGLYVSVWSSRIFELLVTSFECAPEGDVSVHVPPVRILACYFVIPRGEHTQAVSGRQRRLSTCHI